MQSVGLGHVDRALNLWEHGRVRGKSDASFVPSLIPIGALSPTPLWEPHQYGKLMHPSQIAPAPSGPPRFGNPEGFEPQGGVFL